MSARPPRLWERAMGLLLPAADRVEALGDLHEEFLERLATHGPRAARRWYRRQVASSLRPALARFRAGFAGSGAVGDLRLALRGLRRHPVRAVVLPAILALGLGSAATVFTLTDQVLLRGLPYAEGDRLHSVWNVYPGWRGDEVLSDYWDQVTVSWPEFEDIRDRSTTLEASAAYGFIDGVLTDPGDPTNVSVGMASAGLFPLLGTRPFLGRFFAPGEVGSEASAVAVLTHEFWVSRLGGDSGAVGRTIRLQGRALEVIGVLPPGFRLRGQSPFGKVGRQDLWVPAGLVGGVDQRGNRSFEVLARPRGEIATGDVEAELARLVWPGEGADGRRMRLASRFDEEVASVRRPMEVLLGSSLLLLLVVAANLALVRIGDASSRRGEWATRRALGAGSGHLLRLVTMESAVAGLIGTLGGMLVASGLVSVLVALAPADLLLGVDVRPDGRTLLFLLGCGPGIALVTGRFGAPGRSRRSTAASSRTVAFGGDRGTRAVLVTQVALSMVLLCGAALFLRSFLELSAVSPGFDPEGVRVVRVVPGSEAVAVDPAGFHRAIEDRVAAIPGVRSATVTTISPLGRGLGSSSFEIASRPTPEGEKSPEALRRYVGADFFDVLGVPVLEGRPFTGADGPDDRPVAVISQALADAWWPSTPPIGDAVIRDGVAYEIVGIVGDVVRESLRAEPEPTFYLPIAQVPARAVDLVVRADAWTEARSSALRAILRDADPGMAIPPIETMDARLRVAASADRFRSTVAALFAVAAGLLVALGLFGVALQAAQRRRREVGVRVALGASTRQVTRSLIRAQLGLALVGVAIGGAVVLVLGRSFGGLLYGIPSHDPVALAAAGAVLLGIAVAATGLPARRAARADPKSVLSEG